MNLKHIHERTCSLSTCSNLQYHHFYVRINHKQLDSPTEQPNVAISVKACAFFLAFAAFTGEFCRTAQFHGILIGITVTPLGIVGAHAGLSDEQIAH